MKKLAVFSLVLLLLTGCSAQEPLASSPAASAASSSSEKSVNMSADTLRSNLEAQGLNIREILPYEGDWMIYAEDSPDCGQFLWYYTKAEILAPLYVCTRNILDYEILYPGCIRILAGENNIFNGWKDFPTYYVAHTALVLDQEGNMNNPLYSDTLAERETYYAPIEESHSVGCLREESVVDLRITASGAEIVFGPVESNTTDFFAAASSPPLTDITCERNIMTLTFRKTALTSGDPPVYDDPQQQKYHAEYVELYGFPTAFPAGSVEGNSLFIEKAEIQERGEDTTLTLTLTEKAGFYTVETGQLLRDESRPYLYLKFRDAPSRL